MTKIEQALSEIKRRAENVDTLKSGVHITIREDVLTEVLIEMVRARDRVVVEARAALEHYDEAPARHSVHVLSRYMRAVRESLAVLDTPPSQEQKR